MQKLDVHPLIVNFRYFCQKETQSKIQINNPLEHQKRSFGRRVYRLINLLYFSTEEKRFSIYCPAAKSNHYFLHPWCYRQYKTNISFNWCSKNLSQKSFLRTQTCVFNSTYTGTVTHTGTYKSSQVKSSIRLLCK